MIPFAISQTENTNRRIVSEAHMNLDEEDPRKSIMSATAFAVPSAHFRIHLDSWCLEEILKT
jgi:hypothetical protein